VVVLVYLEYVKGNNIEGSKVQGSEVQGQRLKGLLLFDYSLEITLFKPNI